MKNTDRLEFVQWKEAEKEERMSLRVWRNCGHSSWVHIYHPLKTSEGPPSPPWQDVRSSLGTWLIHHSIAHLFTECPEEAIFDRRDPPYPSSCISEMEPQLITCQWTQLSRMHPAEVIQTGEPGPALGGKSGHRWDLANQQLPWSVHSVTHYKSQKAPQQSSRVTAPHPLQQAKGSSPLAPRGWKHSLSHPRPP